MNINTLNFRFYSINLPENDDHFREYVDLSKYEQLVDQTRHLEKVRTSNNICFLDEDKLDSSSQILKEFDEKKVFKLKIAEKPVFIAESKIQWCGILFNIEIHFFQDKIFYYKLKALLGLRKQNRNEIIRLLNYEYWDTLTLFFDHHAQIIEDDLGSYISIEENRGSFVINYFNLHSGIFKVINESFSEKGKLTTNGELHIREAI